MNPNMGMNNMGMNPNMMGMNPNMGMGMNPMMMGQGMGMPGMGMGDGMGMGFGVRAAMRRSAEFIVVLSAYPRCCLAGYARDGWHGNGDGRHGHGYGWHGHGPWGPGQDGSRSCPSKAWRDARRGSGGPFQQAEGLPQVSSLAWGLSFVLQSGLLLSTHCSHPLDPPLCRWNDTGNCPYGDSCKYSHGGAENRMPGGGGPAGAGKIMTPKPAGAMGMGMAMGMGDKPKGAMHKTRLCERFMETQICPYGDKCTFAHG